MCKHTNVCMSVRVSARVSVSLEHYYIIVSQTLGCGTKLHTLTLLLASFEASSTVSSFDSFFIMKIKLTTV